MNLLLEMQFPQLLNAPLPSPGLFGATVKLWERSLRRLRRTRRHWATSFPAETPANASSETSFWSHSTGSSKPHPTAPLLPSRVCWQSRSLPNGLPCWWVLWRRQVLLTQLWFHCRSWQHSVTHASWLTPLHDHQGPLCYTSTPLLAALTFTSHALPCMCPHQ